MPDCRKGCQYGYISPRVGCDGVAEICFDCVVDENAALKAENAVLKKQRDRLHEKLQIAEAGITKCHNTIWGLNQKTEADIQRLEGEFVRATTRKPGSKIPPLPESKE